MLNRALSRTGLVLCTLGATFGLSMTPVTDQAEACFGYTPPPPPMPECFKNYTFSFNVPHTVLFTPGGITVPLELNHFVSLSEANPMVPVCPPGPFLVRASATIMCDDGTVLSADLADFSTPGSGNVQTADAIFIQGLTAPGCCMITITSSIFFSPDCVFTQTTKQSFCVVEESTDIPGVPRLEIKKTLPGIFGVGPGDQASMCYTICNNDLDECVEVKLNADMINVAGAPTGGTASNTVVVADPTVLGGDIGDNFPIGWEDLLPPPFFCVELPPDPGGFPIPVITRTIKLNPGESVDVKVASRPWPMCADGSCGQSLLIGEGCFENDPTVPVKACASAVVVVDNFAPPQFAWPGTGVPGCMGPDPIGGSTGVGGMGFPFPFDPSKPVDLCLIPQPLPPVPMFVNGNPFPAESQFVNVLAGAADLGKWGQRFDLVVFPDGPQGQFTVDSFFDIAYQIQVQGGFKGANQGAIVQDIAVAPGSPQGLETVAPAGMGNILLPVPDPLCPDVLAQLTHQVTSNAQLDDGNVVPIEIVALNLQAAGPNLIQVQMQGFVPQPQPGARGAGGPPSVLRLNISNDFRTFFSIEDTAPLCAADFDGDGDVDLTDFGTFGAAFGSSAGDANYNPAADFDLDGDVDLTDFGTFGSEFGRTDC